jgi:PAS domain S-box-containing protein
MTKDSRSIHILVIEDNMGDYVLVEEYLSDQFDHANLTHVSTFKEAVEEIRKPSSNYDVVLLDLTLPDKNGEELIQATTEVAPNIPILVLTGFTDLKFSVKTLSMGISDYLLKDDLSPVLLYKSISYAVERYAATQKIRESEKNYRQLFELSPEPVVLFDLETYQFIDVNRAAILTYGYSKEEFLSMTLMDLKPEREVESAKQVIKDTIDEKNIKLDGEHHHVKKGGEEITVEITASTIEYKDKKARVALSRDVTQKRKEEERLKLLESVITNSTEAVIILEAEKVEESGRRILFINEAFTGITGYKRGEVLDKTLEFLYGPKTDYEDINRVRKSMEKWEVCEAEMLHYRKDGSEFWVSTSFIPVQSKDNGHSHWVVIARDISQRKKYQEDLEESLTEKSILLAEIHHRVKNNLAVVSSMMQLQAFEEGNEEVQKKLLDSTFRIRTMATIHEILYQSGSFSKLIFTEITDQLVQNIDEVFSNGKKIECQVKSDKVELNINQAIPCSLIINEVITNIYKHAFQKREEGKIDVSLKTDGENIAIRISDNGRGLPKGFNFEESGSLGMNIIKILTSQLDGKSHFKSSEKGTIFELIFKKNEYSGIGSARVR